MDARITYSLVTVYRSKCQQLFRGCRAVSVAWDPGTYSNVSWNMGLMAATGEQCFACDLVPKAPPTPPLPTSSIRLVTHTSNSLVPSLFAVGCVFGRGDLRVALGFLGGLSLPPTLSAKITDMIVMVKSEITGVILSKHQTS